jgi:hypothetical protein
MEFGHRNNLAGVARRASRAGAIKPELPFKNKKIPRRNNVLGPFVTVLDHSGLLKC